MNKKQEQQILDYYSTTYVGLYGRITMPRTTDALQFYIVIGLAKMKYDNRQQSKAERREREF